MRTGSKSGSRLNCLRAKHKLNWGLYREKLSEYLDAVRDVERRIQKAEAQSARELPVVDRPTGGVPASFEDYREFVETRPAAVVANIALCLIHQTNYLLDQQLRRLEQDFLKDGGLRERMTRARLQYRNQGS